MPDNGDKQLVPLNGRHLPHGFSDDVVARALVLMQSTASVAHAHSLLGEEMQGQLVPDYKTLWMWARQHQDVIATIQTDKKRDYVAMAGEVAAEYADRMLGAKLSDSQLPVAYGIAMQRRTDWDKAGQVGPIQAVQINLVGADGKRIGEV